MKPIFGQQQQGNSYSLPMGGNNFMRANQIGGPSKINVFKMPQSNPQRVGMPSQQSLIGSSVSGQMGGQPQFNLFGADKFGNQKFELFPSSEPREYFGPFKEAVDRENRLKGGKDFRQGRLSREGLFEAHRELDGTAKNKIFSAYISGDISKEQATSLATRIQDYFNTKTQQDIFSDLIGQKEEQPIKPQAYAHAAVRRGLVGGSSGPTFSSSYV